MSKRADDYIDIGSDPIKLRATIDRWAARRLDTRSNTEMWEDLDDDMDTTMAA
jgi:hypothetical protein